MDSNLVLFNASSSGVLLTEKQGERFTEVMASRILELEKERDTGLNANGNKVKFEGTKKPEELAELIKRRDAPPQLSDTAKAMVRKVWLRNEKNIHITINSKYLDKGLIQEEESISLISELDNVLYSKNEERIENEYFTGECDIKKDFNKLRKIIDAKTCWSADTFMESKPSLDNIVQGQIYMELYDADEFELKFCLIDTPEHLIQREKDFVKRKYFDGDMSDAELQHLEDSMAPIYERIESNMKFSTNPLIQKEECVKTFHFKRDREMYAKLVEKAKLAREYYKTLKLNHIEIKN